MTLRASLEAAGLRVQLVAGWGTRGSAWAVGKPVGVMEHHTALPVPFPVSRLYGDRLKCNINTKPDGTVWLIAQGACNYSSGSGSSIVLGEVRAGTPPTRNARERNLVDNINGNPWFFNFENDHPGDGSPMPQVQHDAIVTATRVVLDHYGLTPGNVISHAEWTARKRDPYWNGSLRAIEKIRQDLEDDMPLTQADADLVANTLLGRNLPIASIPLLTALDRNYRNVNELTVAHRAGNLGTTAFAEIEDDDLADIAKAVNDELARRTQG